jgi:hypothetical protein
MNFALTGGKLSAADRHTLAGHISAGSRIGRMFTDAVEGRTSQAGTLLNATTGDGPKVIDVFISLGKIIRASWTPDSPLVIMWLGR